MNAEFWSSLESEIIENNQIDNQLYTELNVKRGLRNDDGSGVLAGLSKISSVIGSKKSESGMEPVEGQLRYRGIEINTLIRQLSSKEHNSFEKTIYMLLIGRLPEDDEFRLFNAYLQKEKFLPLEITRTLIQSLPSPNIMNKVQTVISGLYTKDDTAESQDPVDNVQKSISIIAKLPVIVAYAYLAYYESNPSYVEPEKHDPCRVFFIYT